MIFKSFISAILLLPGVAQANWFIRPHAGLGFTTNANYEDSNEDSDFYLFLKNSAVYTSDRKYWTLWLSYRAYAEEKHNDAFNWRAGHELPHRFKLGEFDLDFGVGGQHYTGDNPGTTEENFDFVYAEGSISRTRAIRPNTELFFEGGYQAKNFTRFGGRWDHTIFAGTGLDWQISGRNSLLPAAEFGIVVSNDSLYRKNYLEIGLNWHSQIRPDLKTIAGFLTRFSTYPNRTVSQETAVSRRRGTTKFSTQEENETHSLMQLKGSVVKMWKEVEFTGSLLLNDQDSKSGFEDYTELSLLGFASFNI